MGKRVMLAGLLGAIVMFLWASLAHLVLDLGNTGIQEIPNEQGVLSALHSALGDASGLYLFPGMGVGPGANRQAAMAQYGKKLAANPSGILIYHPPGRKALDPGQLLTEFLSELVEALLLAFLLAQTRLATFGASMGFALAAGLLAVITTNVSYWNWYGFPASYTIAYMGVELVGYLLVGAVAAAILRRGRPAAA